MTDATEASPAAALEIPVRFEVAGKALDLDKVNRLARRLLEGQADKFRKKYAGTVGPSGETPTIVIRAVRMMDKKIEVVLEYPESMKDAIKGHDKAVRVA